MFVIALLLNVLIDAQRMADRQEKLLGRGA